jgi:gas vesicle protein
MDDRTKVLVGGVAGAILGSLAGYLLLTRRGEQLRRDVVPQLEQFLGHVKELQAALVQARQVATESWQTLQEITSRDIEPGIPPSTRTH